MNTSTSSALSLPAELSHPAIALEAVSSSRSSAPDSVPAPAPTVPLLSTFGQGTQRQLELTVNTMARTVRKTIRRAETLEREGDYAEAEKVWEQVNQRSAMLQELSRTLATSVPQPTSPAQAPASAPVAEPRDLTEDAAQIDAMFTELTRLQDINDLQDANLRARKIRDIDAQKARIREAYLQLAAQVPASPRNYS